MQRKLGYAKTSAHPTYESLLREALLPVQLLLCMERSREQNPQRLLRLTGALNNLELLLAEEMRSQDTRSESDRPFLRTLPPKKSTPGPGQPGSPDQ